MYLWILSDGHTDEYRICSDIDILKRYIKYKYSYADIIFEEDKKGNIVAIENKFPYDHGYIIKVKEIENFIIGG